MDVDDCTLRERLVARRYNVFTGSEHNLSSKNTAEILVSGALGIHPKDYRSAIEEDVSFLFHNFFDILKKIHTTLLAFF